ncbi:DUF1929-domain-containing protein [Obba rivulosa]|uniref:DUF1929-domain-containing protein n=1 Tax=Obba rivulosa TaxID=1052685 RepID=A0A8E2DIC0_9APHY|nr:DUF1929-domain-containing protein [Obba rivulosa]
MGRQLSALAISLAALSSAAFAQTHTPGSFEDGGDTLVSAMMLFLGNENKVYILDKAEGNSVQVGGHPAWAAVYDIETRTATPMDMTTNTFCSSGMHLPNGSYVTFGGNGAVGPGGNISDVTEPGGFTGLYSTVYGDWDGRTEIRLLNPCDDDLDSQGCQWYDNRTDVQMQKARWYSTAEPLGDGSIAIIGGFVNGGYVNRNTPNVDPTYEGGAAEPTTEFYPSKGPAQVMNFMVQTSGLNAYAHTFLMPDGRLFLQANYSSVLWDPNTNEETPLPDMPGQIIRVYPASGATAMLPLTPANNYTPTVLFCGGSDMPESYWGNYTYPNFNTWEYPASNKCHQITPEPTDGSAPQYTEVDDMLEGRTMGQFIHLPDMTMLVVNGGLNGTAGYSTNTPQTPLYGDMPFGMSLASGPVGTPAIYNPNAPAGQRWSNSGLQTSNITRLYHSSALLLPDASVLIAGSNPNVDVNLTTIFPTTYKAEIFYPPYFSAETRPAPQNVPTNLTYGGDPFDITIPASSYSGAANNAADNTTVVAIRPGWTTHAMNMGQRSMQLNNTYTVNSDGSITLHVAQPPPNPNLVQPGPVLLFVTVYGIPSNGTMAILGDGQIGPQATAPASVLPPSIRLDNVSGSAPSSGSNSSNSSNGSSASSTDSSQSNGASHTGAIIGGIVGAIAVVGILGAIFGICLARRKRAAAQQHPASSYPMSATQGGAGGALGNHGVRSSDSSAFVPLQQDNQSAAWGNASNASLASPYRDEPRVGHSAEFDPYYQNAPQMSANQHGY